jgi:hypothetical protein
MISAVGYFIKMNKVKLLILAVLAVLSFGISVFAQIPYGQISQNFQQPRSLPILVIDSTKMPTIATHIRQAQAAGYPSILTRTTIKSQIESNRDAACGSFTRPPGKECDEYPFASTYEGGMGSGKRASVMAVPPHEQRVQGGTLSAFYRKLKHGSKFRVCVGKNKVCS